MLQKVFGSLKKTTNKSDKCNTLKVIPDVFGDIIWRSTPRIALDYFAVRQGDGDRGRVLRGDPVVVFLLQFCPQHLSLGNELWRRLNLQQTFLSVTHLHKSTWIIPWSPYEQPTVLGELIRG